MPWKSKGQPPPSQKALAKKPVICWEASHDLSLPCVIQSLQILTAVLALGDTESLTDPTEITEEVCRKAESQKHPPCRSFYKGIWKSLSTDVATSDWMVLTKGKSSQNHKGGDSALSCCSFRCQQFSGLIGCWDSDFTWRGVGTQPWIEQYLRGCDINIHSIQWGIQYRRMTGNTKPPPSPSASLFSWERRFLVELETTLISQIFCAALSNLLNFLF